VDGIENRIIALPIPNAVYNGLVAGPGGTVFTLASRARAVPQDVAAAISGSTLGKFSFSDRKWSPFSAGVQSFSVTPDGTKALLGTLGGFAIVSTMAPPPPGAGDVSLSDLVVKIDPKVEWAAMYHSIWRNERLRFYSPTINGLDTYEVERRYAPFLRNISSRTDLNYLFDDMLGELCVGHEFPGGGELPRTPSVPGGLLGADFSFSNNRYRIDRVYTGERWNPTLFAPLAQPGVNAKTGEYLLSIDGHDLTTSTDLYLALEAKAGKQVKIKIGSNADGTGSREVTVQPIRSEFGLRQRAWEEDNRAYVVAQTHGRAGYVHVPDTNFGGWEAFTRFYYAQVGKDGMVVDERFNHGGLINDYMIREMLKPMDAAFQPRFGKPWPTPGSAIFGPKVMLINEMSGSGGDMFPWLFRHEKVGKIVGKRTWGGLIAAAGFQTLDGGSINAPDYAFWNVDANTWDVENWGVSPDQDVELDPYVWRQGHDSQLDAAIAEINKRLDEYKPKKLQHPPYPDRTKLNVHY
jgi:tricorn protease